jgi:hypothetical protein
VSAKQARRIQERGDSRYDRTTGVRKWKRDLLEPAVTSRLNRLRCTLPLRVLAILLLSAACQRSPTAPTAITIPEYDRSEWQLWIDADSDCQDTRQEVLIEESLIAPTLDPRGCRVLAGRWLDAYTGAVYTDPAELEVDHRVPLANAHRSGGWAWSQSRKREYANDLIDPEHLVAVSAAANRNKSDKGPDAWRPPSRENWCHYATAWRGVKQRWTLTLTAEEDRATREMCS